MENRYHNSYDQNSIMINVRAFVSLIGYAILSIAEHIIISEMEIGNGASYFTLSVILVFNLAVQIGGAKINNLSLCSFFMVFIYFYNLMHFGEVFMLGFFPDYKYDYINYITVYMSNEDLLRKPLCSLSIA